MDDKELKSIIEGILFVFGDPIESKEIAKVMNISSEKTEKLLLEMKNEFDYSRRGIRIVMFNNSYQLGTRVEHHDWIQSVVAGRNKRSLSNAALETLSIIAYKQPVTKLEVDYIRGVKSDRSLETLINRKLVVDKGRLDKPGKPIIYGTTDDFLKYFGLQDLNDLPSIQDFKMDSEI